MIASSFWTLFFFFLFDLSTKISIELVVMEAYQSLTGDDTAPEMFIICGVEVDTAVHIKTDVVLAAF